MIIDTIKVLKANDGMILTDGEIYAKTVLLPEGRTADEFHEITESEYNEVLKELENDTDVCE